MHVEVQTLLSGGTLEPPFQHMFSICHFAEFLLSLLFRYRVSCNNVSIFQSLLVIVLLSLV